MHELALMCVQCDCVYNGLHAWSMFSILLRTVWEWSLIQSVCLQSYIDFEIGEGNRQNTRDLYERLLSRTKHVKVYASIARVFLVRENCGTRCTD